METQQLPPSQTKPKKTNRLFLVVCLSVFLTTLITGITVYFWQSQQNKKTINSLEQKIAFLEKQALTKNQAKTTPQASFLPKLSPIPTPDPTADWNTYSGSQYIFKYPKEMNLDTGVAGQGFESIRVQFVGSKQTDTGKTETSLTDGYSFSVTKIISNKNKTAQQQAKEERANSRENCTFGQSKVLPVIKTQVAGTTAFQYSVTGCFGDYTSTYLVNSDNLYRITQLYTGEESKKQKYKSITYQILSTFKFTK